MIPKSREGRHAGHGGGGYGGAGVTVPHNCNRCGRRYSGRTAMQSVHLCPSCKRGGKKGRD
jgi:hypothetical protein